MREDSQQLSETLQAVLDRATQRAPIRQGILAVESGDGATRWIATAGQIETTGMPVRADTPFFLASIDKLYNAALALKLVEAGRLDLDAPIGSYLPVALSHWVHRLGGTDYSGQITARHLMTHMSGLADWLEDRPSDGPSLLEQVLAEGDRALTDIEIIDHVRQRLRPHFPPQDLAGRRSGQRSGKRLRVRYSDTNYILLVALLETLTGAPLERLHEDLLFRPLGLRHSYFCGRSTGLDPAPAAMTLRGAGRAVHLPLLLRSIRGLYADAADAIGFLRALTRGAVFDDPATLARMTRHMHRFGLPLDRAALRAPGWPIEYGLGIMRFRLPRIFSPFTPMPAVLGHTGSTGCWLFHCPDRDLFLAGSVDEVTAGALPYRIVPRILRMFPSSP